MSQRPEAKLHPGHHWGPFANDPWSPDLDPVVGEIWERAARAGRVSVKPAPVDAIASESRGDDLEKPPIP